MFAHFAVSNTDLKNGYSSHVGKSETFPSHKKEEQNPSKTVSLHDE